jgi:D-glycero-D-manno-heptose 1,7-bisphosphate phosphatase
VILDRDGVINHDSDEFIKSPDEWHPIPGSLEAIARLHRAGIVVAVATNQSGVGRGLLDLPMLERIHGQMLDALRQHGGAIAEIVFCPHHPDEGCACRKPEPGMLYEIARRLRLSLEGLPVVGDSDRDLIAARRVSASPVLVRTGKGLRTLRSSSELAGVAVFDDLAAFVDDLLAGHRGSA